jgi:hypothetical protein
MLDAATLRQLLSYEPRSGIFRWRVKRGRGVTPGDIAGSYDHHANGCYVRIHIKERKYYAHQLAWLYMTGRWSDEIDHRNRQPADNRWNNLHEVTHAANGRNQVLRNTNTSGHVGVYQHKSGVFHPYIMVDGRKHHLGSFPTFEQAVAARIAAQQQYGFSFGHGRRREAPSIGAAS